MPQSSFVLKKKPPKAATQSRIVREEIRKDLKKVATSHVRSREKVVRRFSRGSRPSFKSRVVVTAKQVSLQVFVTEADPKRPIWKWIDKTGTPAHDIDPLPDNETGRLWFLDGEYRPITRPNPPRSDGAGQPSGNLIGVLGVRHPGFPPRKFSEAINEDLREDELKAIRNGGRRGLRKARKA